MFSHDIHEVSQKLEYNVVCEMEILNNFKTNILITKSTPTNYFLDALKPISFNPLTTISFNFDDNSVSFCTENYVVLIFFDTSEEIRFFLNNIKNHVLYPVKKKYTNYISNNFHANFYKDNQFEKLQSTKEEAHTLYNSLSNDLNFLISQNNLFSVFLKHAVWPILYFFIERFKIRSTLFQNPSFLNPSIQEFRQFSMQDFILLSIIGSGAVGIIYLALNKALGQLFVIKSFKNGKIKQFRREKQAYSKLKHPSLLKCYGFIKESKSKNISNSLVLEFAANGSVADYLDKNSLDDTEKTTIVVDVLFGLDYLHSLGIMHRDIKPHNILLTNDFDAKICDFDTSREYLSSKKKTHDIGTYLYMSPEEINGEDYSFQTDLYSFSMFIYELATGKAPYEVASISDIIQRIESGNIANLSHKYGPIVHIYYMCSSHDASYRTCSFYLITCMKDRNLFFEKADWILVQKRINFLVKNMQPVDINRGDIQFMIEEAEKGKTISQFYLARLYESGQGFPIDLQQAFLWYSRAAYGGNHSAQFNIGQMYMNGKGVEQDYYRAFEIFLYLAKKGDNTAQLKVSTMYKEGKGVFQDDKMSFYWLNEAAINGSSDAQVMLALMYLKGNEVNVDYEKAAFFYQLAASTGNVTSQFGLGMLYLNGQGVEKDNNKAISLLTEAADKGHSLAQYNLGHIYFTGEIASTNYTKAFYYLTKSAEQGHPPAQYSLGIMYLNGLGTPTNYQIAYELYQMAAEAGVVEAMHSLGIFLLENTYGYQNMEEAIIWITISADKDYNRAQHLLGLLYQEGKGVEKDYRTAADLFYKSAQTKMKDSAFRCAHLYHKLKIEKDRIIEMFQKAAEKNIYHADAEFGEMYFNGDIVEQDYEKAFHYLSEATKNENAKAFYLLGQMYENGYYVEKDLNKAVDFYFKAAKIFSPEAEANLEKLCNTYTQFFMPKIEKISECTKKKFGTQYISQHIFECDTCGLIGGRGICIYCAEHCHSGHELVDIGICPEFFCDCESIDCQFHSDK
ncbi:hypothetical protein TRFO_34522 [Tritrichomonas foetus]|uniref:Protein kinase domain-containing protein n=1 Tax=Tritrichomonas foetus TaxID=1144522 RepID=A0A1J4JIW2_9EUKA|nr:hypothetical protein TRFO_34522 [Tritrichomonas foetus]|eukprot:OHS99120.1 hypothetical protein TRFO_34522 [Tritrichomonas foetus]